MNPLIEHAKKLYEQIKYSNPEDAAELLELIQQCEEKTHSAEDDARILMEKSVPALILMRGKMNNCKDPVPIEEYKRALAFKRELDETLAWAAAQPHIRNEINELHMDIVDAQRIIEEVKDLPEVFECEQARLERLQTKLSELE